MTQYPSNRNQSESDEGLRQVSKRLITTIQRDALVLKTLDQLRSQLTIDRVALYYFYRQWKGQVTAESLSSPSYSIYGCTGADDCFNDEYAQLYLEGRIHAIDDVAGATIQACHRDFLDSIQVKANLVAPILVSQKLWGLIAAHHCQAPRVWHPEDYDHIKEAAHQLASAPSINL